MVRFSSLKYTVKIYLVLSLLILSACEEKEDGTAEEQELNFIAAKKKISFYLAKEEPGEAERVFDSLEYNNTRSYDYYLMAGTVKSHSGKFAESIEYFQRALAIYETEEGHVQLAEIYRELKDSAMFIMTIKRLIELSPNDARYYIEYASYFAAQGVFSVAIDYITKAIFLTNVNNLPSYYVKRGEFRFAFDDLKGALADCDTAIMLDREYCMAYILKAEWYLSKSLFKEAIKSASESLKSSCDKGHLLFRRGLAKFLSDDVLGAREDMLKAADLQNEAAIQYIKYTAPYGFRILFPIKYREAAASDFNNQQVVVTRDSCAKWKLVPTSFSLAVPAIFKVKYKVSDKCYCSFTQKDKKGVIIQEIKLVESLSLNDEKSVYEVERWIKQNYPTFKATSLKKEIIGNSQYFVLRGTLNFDQYKSPEYKGGYYLTYFIVPPTSNTVRGFSWNEITQINKDPLTSKAQASRIINSLYFHH